MGGAAMRRARWGQALRALYVREVRSALRERTVVINSLLLPVVLYPLLLWLEISALSLASGMAERAPSRVAVVDGGGIAAALVDRIVPTSGDDPRAATGALFAPAQHLQLDQALARLGDRSTDAVLEVLPPPPDASGLPGNFAVTLHYDGSIDRSRRARDRLQDLVGDYRADRLEAEAEALSMTAVSVGPFALERRNASSEGSMHTALLSLMLPLFLVISVALGCLVPAVDTTAGERERGTWETLMSTQATRGTIVTAKYLYVASFGVVAGLANVGAMALTLGPMLAPLQGLESGPGELARSLGPSTLLVMASGAVLLGAFFGAAMMLAASLARTFKDGQAMVTPVFYLALLPLILGTQSDRTLTPAIALLPVANVAMAVRDAIQGIFLWPLLALSAATLGALVLLLLAVARWVLGFEDFLMGTHGGSVLRFATGRLRRGRAASAGRP